MPSPGHYNDRGMLTNSYFEKKNAYYTYWFMFGYICIAFV